jgi:hypothetical protein
MLDNRPATAHARTGGPRRAPSIGFERNERVANDRGGSHMPIDTGIHWEWRNPLNILPALILLFLLIDLVAMVLA